MALASTMLAPIPAAVASKAPGRVHLVFRIPAVIKYTLIV